MSDVVEKAALDRLTTAMGEDPADESLTFKPFPNPLPRGYRWLSQFRGYVIAFEGNIGAGKTTKIELLVKYAKKAGLKAVALIETVDPDLLQAMIAAVDKRPGYNSNAVYEFQMDMLARRQETYETAQVFAAQGYIVFLDRSLLGDYTFARLHLKAGRFSREQWRNYREKATSTDILAPHAMIYLTCRVETLLERIKRRNRPGEEKYAREYLAEVDAAYQEAMANAPYPILRLEWDEDRALGDEDEQKRVAQNFFKKLQALVHEDQEEERVPVVSPPPASDDKMMTFVMSNGTTFSAKALDTFPDDYY